MLVGLGSKLLVRSPFVAADPDGVAGTTRNAALGASEEKPALLDAALQPGHGRRSPRREPAFG
eukprot:10477754-Alexandrium_andersonii.AAC.1